MGLLVAAGGGVLVGTSGHFVHPVAYGLQVSLEIAGAVAASLYFTVRRPGNRIGLVLLVYAVAFAGVSLEGSGDPLLFSIGVLCEAPMFVLGYYLIFIFPDGRLVYALDRVLFLGVACIFVASFLPYVFFTPVLEGGAPLAVCKAACPANALMISNDPTLANAVGPGDAYPWLPAIVAILGWLGYRFLTASRPRRRALLPVYMPALLLTIPFGLFHVGALGLIGLSPKAIDTLGWFLTAGRTSLAFGFVLAIWQATIVAGAALRAILAQLGRREDASHLRALVSEALDDPPLELGFEVDRGARVFVDSGGERFEPNGAVAGRTITALMRHGRTVAYIDHDEALKTDPELVQATGRAILLALESGRLEGELEAKIAELQNSRERIVAAGDVERRRLERDLHDGAQQRLVAIQIRLGMVRDLPDRADIGEVLDAIQEDADGAMEDLRTLARGIYPDALHQDGLSSGLRSLARNAAIPIDVVDAGIGGFAPPAKDSVSLFPREAIQNVIKHAGPEAHVTVTLERHGSDIQFAIVDDGAGFDPGERPRGIGMMSMRDRIGAVGGDLEIVAAPAHGTVIRGHVPAARAAADKSG
jgi:signal transduction histidine kinase